MLIAAVAMAGIARDSAAARRHFEQRLATVLGRAGITAQESPGRRDGERTTGAAPVTGDRWYRAGPRAARSTPFFRAARQSYFLIPRNSRTSS